MNSTILQALITAIDRLSMKLTSGQWIFTVACAFTFSWCAVEKILDSQAVAAIISSAATFYFTRNRQQPPIS